MAVSFIDSLPNVGRGVLAKDEKCCLCQEEYGTQPSPRGIIERPIRLPCNHILGSECITLWLTGEGNSCPLCRRIFFSRQGPEEDEGSEDSDGEDDDGGYTIYQILAVAEFDINDREQYLQRRSATPSLTAPPDFSREVADHSWRLRCERTLYSFLQARNHDLPELCGDESTELEEHHLTFLFKDFEERGIFNELWGNGMGGYSADRMLQLPTRREMWDLIRDLGFGYGPSYGSIQDEDRGRWSRMVWYPWEPSRGGLPWWMVNRNRGGW